MRFGRSSRPGAGESPDTDSAFSDDASSMLSSSESSTSSASTGNKQDTKTAQPPRKVLVEIYCADGSTKESLLIDPVMTVGTALRLMAEKSHVNCHVKWGLVEHLPDLGMERCLEDDEKLLRILSTWKPSTKNRLVFAQRPEKYDLFRHPERYLLNPYEHTEVAPWDNGARQELLQKVISTANEAATTQLEGPLWLKAEGKKSWKKFHFILRDGNLFQTTKSKKMGSVHDVHCVASLATVKVFNGLGWKRKHKAPTDFCFALKPPEVQEKKQHIRYLCADNEWIKWAWYTTLRLTLGPPQQLVDNYNSQLGVPIPRSDSLLSASSSGCGSDPGEDVSAGFHVEYPEGGTIKRKPPQTVQQISDTIRRRCVVSDNMPPPPPPEPTLEPDRPDQEQPLPPPPTVDVVEQQVIIREELYPCGVMRTRFPAEVPQDEAGVNQMSLLQQLPTQPPPSLQSLMLPPQQEMRSSLKVNNNNAGNGMRTKKISFSELVHSIEDSEWHPLKGKEDGSANNEEDEEGYNEKDVSNWVLESLRHCPGQEGTDNGRPKQYNGRSVPNCFSPQEVQELHRRSQEVLRKLPPPPPMRSGTTSLTNSN